MICFAEIIDAAACFFLISIKQLGLPLCHDQ